MSSLPPHGRIDCDLCFTDKSVLFDLSRQAEGDWRITANPMAWGNANPEVVLLGFSKGPTQSGALAKTPHDEIAYKGRRTNVGKILAHVGLVRQADSEDMKRQVESLIASQSGKFHCGSLIRCTVERFEQKSGSWKGSGGGMLDKFVATPFGRQVVANCSRRFLGDLPTSTRLVVMFGLGTKLNYVDQAFNAFRSIRPGAWNKLNEISYSDGGLTVVHVEHFAAQGRLIPDWLGMVPNARAALGRLAREAVASAIQWTH